MIETVEGLQPLTYRQLQAECKARGIPAKGNSEELRGRLTLKIQEEQSTRPVSAATPPPARKRLTSQEPHETAPMAGASPATLPSPRRRIDESMWHRAMGTPLPKSPRRTSLSPQRRFPLLRILLFAVVSALCASVPLVLSTTKCRGMDCALHYKTFGESALALSQVYARQGWESSLQSAVQLALDLKYQAAVWREQAGQKVAHYMEMYDEWAGPPLFSWFWGNNSNASAIDSIGSLHGHKNGFNGVLNSAVLRSVLREDQGSGWEELHQLLWSVWKGSRISPHKANVVLFACGSRHSCASAQKELVAAAPLEATLVLSAVDLAAGRGELQARFSHFLRDQPQGVVVLPDIDKVPKMALPVLNTAMGEFGAFQLDGEQVPATRATFLLTWQAPPVVLAEDSETSFTLAAKKDLTLTLLQQHAPEGGESTAVVDAFRRRIDLVAATEISSDETE